MYGRSGAALGARPGAMQAVEKRRTPVMGQAGGAAGGRPAGAGMSNLGGAVLSDEDEKEVSTYEPQNDEERAFAEAFPDNDWSEDRMAAFKEGIRLCFERHSAGDYGGDEGMSEEPPSDSGGKGGLALLFGEPKKKR
jgi:hypothetical protein